MSRLTKKVGENYCSQSGDFYDLYNKLGRLEDLEEELGCSLDVVLNLIKQGHFYAEKPNHKGKAYCMFLPTIMFVAKGCRNIEDNSFILSASTMQLFNRKELRCDGWDVQLSDYKKTWWLKADRSE